MLHVYPAFYVSNRFHLIHSQLNRNWCALDGRNTDVKNERKIATIAGRVSMYPRLLILVQEDLI